jgi:hypothetical protein
MAYLKLIDKPYYGDDAIANVYGYITDYGKTNGLTGGLNVILYQAPLIMSATQKAFFKDNGNRLIYFIITSSFKEPYSKDEAMRIAYQTALLFPNHQIVYGIHSDAKRVYIHFMVNSISFIDGSRLKPDGYLLNSLKAHCGRFIPNLECCAGIKNCSERRG